MTLKDITDHSQFEAYYREHHLFGLDDRLRHLKEAIGVLTERHDPCETREESLRGYEDLVLSKVWIPLSGAEA